MTILLSVASVVLAVFIFAVLRRRRKRVLAPSLSSLVDCVAELKGSAEQISSMSADLAAASQEQLDALSTTVSASHQIRSMVERTSESAGHLNTEALGLRDLTGSGTTVIGGMVLSSQEILQGTEHFHEEMQKSIEQLSSALAVIQQIAHKTGQINEIVFQTKLLSFNASVEAARAGEAGRGFSVVAEEVGKLAKMSGGVANEISGIVEQSIASVRGAIDDTKARISVLLSETGKRSELGLANAKDCERIFHEMADKIMQTTEKISQISAASAEQAQGVLQLDQSVQQLQEVADRNRLVASQTTEHGVELETQTKRLADIAADLLRGQGAEGKGARLQPFVWNDRLELKIAAMDDEHKVLVEKINGLVAALQEKRDGAANFAGLRASFEDLAGYTQEHFSDEERFLDSIHYPQLSSHRKIHANLLAQMARYEKQIHQGTLDDEKLVSFLRNWLVSHIMGVDMQYSHFHRGIADVAEKKRSQAA